MPEARNRGVLGGLEISPEKELGVSVVLCCHNSRSLLPTTLEHVAKQVVSSDVKWEVLVIDNGSTDDTGVIARQLWPSTHPVSLRVIDEPLLGLSYARLRGINEARYEFLTFVDDDNWLDSAWVQTTFETLRDRADVAALGGLIQPEFETTEPKWFGAVANLYAIGPSHNSTGDVTDTHILCGAGLGLRHRALLDAQQKGFRSLSVGRQGAVLSAGEDSELNYCLRLSGWRLWIEPRLRLKHFLPGRRLEWRYARRLAYWSAYATPERDALVYGCKPVRHGLAKRLRRLRETWAWQSASALRQLLCGPVGIVKCFLSWVDDGDRDVLRFEFRRGRLDGLLDARGWYAARSSSVRDVIARQGVPLEPEARKVAAAHA